MKVLVLNCGSSSIKFKLYDMPAGYAIARGSVQRIGEDTSEAILEADDSSQHYQGKIVDHVQGLSKIEEMLLDPQKGVIESVDEIGACGHRVVHGGEEVSGSVLITPNIVKIIEKNATLAPLHNPPNLQGIRAAKEMLGDIPQVACFDTAFHQTLPPVAYLYAIPYEMYQNYGIRKYGFHGTSHRYVARRAAKLMNEDKYAVDLVTCHLGNGCSMTAVKGGKSIDTSMGLTPLEGLVMGTRAGDLDVSVVFFLEQQGFETKEIDRLFNKRSGLLGISGISNDVRDLEDKAAGGHERAQLALDIFAYKIKKYIGLYSAVLNGCDAIVFTGGIGENGTKMRQRILQNMENLGIILDEKKNSQLKGEEGEIGAPDSKVRIFVIPTDEEIAIAGDTFEIAAEKASKNK
ncbi:MAG: acetate kinase [candidate division KSB1 bacterium]|nr:acetate kinase [candidate division KSB1 bacterium]